MTVDDNTLRVNNSIQVQWDIRYPVYTINQEKKEISIYVKQLEPDDCLNCFIEQQEGIRLQQMYFDEIGYKVSFLHHNKFVPSSKCKHRCSK